MVHRWVGAGSHNWSFRWGALTIILISLEDCTYCADFYSGKSNSTGSLHKPGLHDSNLMGWCLIRMCSTLHLDLMIFVSSWTIYWSSLNLWDPFRLAFQFYNFPTFQSSVGAAFSEFSISDGVANISWVDGRHTLEIQHAIWLDGQRD